MKKEHGHFVLYGITLILTVFAPQGFCESERLIYFHSSGGFGPLYYAEVDIYRDGKVTVSASKAGSGEFELNMTLNNGDLLLLESLIDSVDFFNRPEKGRYIVDAGYSILEISINGNAKRIDFYVSHELFPLTGRLWRLIEQAEALDNLKIRKDPHDTYMLFRPDRVWPEPFNPWIFEEPLKGFLDDCNERYNFDYAFQALAYAVDAENWANTIREIYDKSDLQKKKMILEVIASHPHPGNFPDGYLWKMSPFLLQTLRSPAIYDEGAEFEDYYFLYSICMILANVKYDLAIPTLEKIKKESPHKSLRYNAERALDSLAVFYQFYEPYKE
jgi:hypothetical protein